MNMPGFSAQASLYKTSGSYRIAGALGQADTAIRPAAIDFDCAEACRSLCESSIQPRTCFNRCVTIHCRWFA